MYTIKQTKNGVAVIKSGIIVKIYSKSNVLEVQSIVDFWNSTNAQPEDNTFGY